jgi:hypothetical protein
VPELEALAVTTRVARALEELGVAYFVGGSLASSFHGIPRASQDADLVADLRAEHVGPLTELLHGEFYIDDERVRDAIRRRASFNVIHLQTLFKVDVFVLWYRLGSGVSERQWSDVLGVLKVKRERLDLDYVRRWAEHLGVVDLLDQALLEAGFPEAREP